MPPNRYGVNRPTIIHQTIDGEVIMINLVTGTYYSLLDTGAEIWEGLVRGVDVDGIVGSLRRRYDGDAVEIEAMTMDFVDQLAREALIVPAEDQAVSGDGASSPSDPSERAGAFREPTLGKYEDMQDLILLDPVHEVQEGEGWPAAKSS
jgi:hypothetical protein